MISVKHITRLSLVSLAVAWGFDLLFWGRAPGISFFVYVVLCITAGALITGWEGLRPARTSLLLLLPVLFFAVISFIRMEPLTMALSYLITLTCLTILVMTWRGGKWTVYSLSDYVVGFFKLAGSALSRPVMLFFFRGKNRDADDTEKKSDEGRQMNLAAEDLSPHPALSPRERENSGSPLPWGDPLRVPEGAGGLGVREGAGGVEGREGRDTGKKKSRQVFSILRGILLAVPVLAILAALLASADPIFSKDLDAFLKLLRIENLAEYIFRGVYIVAGAYLLIGIYLHALGPSSEEKLIGLEKPWMRPFLGWTETVIVLGAVDLLFAFFVAIQARYFFGGQANINTSGYTFAEYARRGFNELVAVAIISLLLVLAASAITRRETPTQRRVFTVLEAGVVILVGVILLSAYQRLLLYEAAYGFTRIRTYTHVFMIWLGILLVAVVALDLRSSLRRFALALVVVALGFGATLSLLNVDDFIARQNITRARTGNELDASYLVTLSDDAVPAMVSAFTDSSLPAAVHDQLGMALSCKVQNYIVHPGSTSWPSYVFSRSNARSQVFLHLSELSAYPVTTLENGSWQVNYQGANHPCYDFSTMD